MVHTIKYFEVGDCYDVEGRGPFEVIANFTDEVEARRWAIGRGNYNHNAQVNPKTLTLCDTIQEMDVFEKEQLKQRALKKLTKEEIEALGL